MELAERIRQIRPFFVMQLLARAKALESQGKSIIHLEIGEPDFPTPQAVVDAGREAIGTGFIRYTPAAGLPPLRRALSLFYRQRYGVDVPGERIFLTPGASGALLLALGALLNPGEEVLLADPGYPCNRNFVCLLGSLPKLVPVDAASGFHLSADALARHWGGNTRGAVIASPANPTGSVIDPAALRQVAEYLAAKGGFLISDEIYHGLVYEKRAASALEFSPEAFVINSFSKYFGMTGWRLGWLVVPDAFIDAVEKLAQNVFIAAPTHSQIAALDAFGDANIDELERRRRAFQERREFLFSELLRLGFEIAAKPEGAFYIYADCSPFSRDSFRFALSLLEEKGVAVTPGRDFGEYRAEQHLRFAYTTSLDNLAEGVRRLEAFIGTGA